MTSKERQVVLMKRIELKIEEMICKETSNFNSNAEIGDMSYQSKEVIRLRSKLAVLNKDKFFYF